MIVNGQHFLSYVTHHFMLQTYNLVSQLIIKLRVRMVVSISELYFSCSMPPVPSNLPFSKKFVLMFIYLLSTPSKLKTYFLSPLSCVCVKKKNPYFLTPLTNVPEFCLSFKK